MNIINLFLSAAGNNPQKIALTQGIRKVSFSQLEHEVRSTAAYFEKKGIRKGDRVLVFVPMSIDLYRIVLALFYLGATAVFLDEWVNKERMELCARIASCKGFTGGFKARLYALFSKELRKIPVKLKLNRQLKKRLLPGSVHEDDAALITFTTGSTGTPKAARRTHGFLKEQFDALLEEISPEESDIDMTVLPIVTFINLGKGCTSVLTKSKTKGPQFVNASLVLEEIQKNKVNRITASPFFIKKLAEHVIDNGDGLSYSGKIFTGGAPVFPSEAALYLKAFPETETVIVYGSTEVEPISSINARELAGRKAELDRGLPVGKPFYKTGVKILCLDDEVREGFNNAAEFEAACLKEGEPGEIVVSGSHVLKDYFNNEEAFRKNKIRVGRTIWHRTGDCGFLKGGELYLNGRCNQMIHREGGWLSPFIIEGKLKAIHCVETGTLLEIKNQLILAVESKLPVKLLEEKTSGIPYDKMVVLSKIPRDPRHHSKIDYEELKPLVLEELK